MTLPTLEQVIRSRTSLRLAQESFLVAVHVRDDRYIETGITELKAAVAALGYELVKRSPPAVSDIDKVTVLPVSRVGIFEKATKPALITQDGTTIEGYVAR